MRVSKGFVLRDTKSGESSLQGKFAFGDAFGSAQGMFPALLRRSPRQRPEMLPGGGSMQGSASAPALSLQPQGDLVFIFISLE